VFISIRSGVCPSSQFVALVGVEDGGDDEQVVHFMSFNCLVFSPTLPITVPSADIDTENPK